MSKQEAHYGVTFLDALCVAFVVLKLTGVIDWSWWAVMAPIWVPLAFLLAVVIVALVVTTLFKD